MFALFYPPPFLEQGATTESLFHLRPRFENQDRRPKPRAVLPLDVLRPAAAPFRARALKWVFAHPAPFRPPRRRGRFGPTWARIGRVDRANFASVASARFRNPWSPFPLGFGAATNLSTLATARCVLVGSGITFGAFAGLGVLGGDAGRSGPMGLSYWMVGTAFFSGGAAPFPL
jgi:hypothetical protein